MVLYYNGELRKIDPKKCIDEKQLQQKLHDLLHPQKPSQREVRDKAERLISVMQAI